MLSGNCQIRLFILNMTQLNIKRKIFGNILAVLSSIINSKLTLLFNDIARPEDYLLEHDLVSFARKNICSFEHFGGHLMSKCAKSSSISTPILLDYLKNILDQRKINTDSWLLLSSRESTTTNHEDC